MALSNPTFPFNEVKATQVAARFLQLRGGKMSYMKLIKLLYLVDREAILRWGRPVTTDCYVSMDKGPVVSRIYDLICSDPDPNDRPWHKFISGPLPNYEVQLKEAPPADELSRAEEELIAEIFSIHGGKSRWELMDYCHNLPEWCDPAGSAIPISFEDILKAGNKSPAEIVAIERELEALIAVDNCLKQ